MAKRRSPSINVDTEDEIVTPEVQSVKQPIKQSAEIKKALAELQEKYGAGAIRMGGIPAIERIPFGLWPFDSITGGGLPRRRWSQFWGGPGCGKTTAALWLTAKIQQSGGVVVFVDAEHSLDPAYATALGVDINSLYYAQPQTLEEAETYVKQLCPMADLVIIDSVVAVSGDKEKRNMDEKGLEKDSMMVTAGALSKFFRVVTPVMGKSNAAVLLINQTRVHTGYVTFDDYSGGMSLRHNLGLCLRLQMGPKDDWPKSDDGKLLLGKNMKITIDKSKITGATQGDTRTYNIWNTTPFVRPELELITGAMTTGIIEKAGNTYNFDGEKLAVGYDATISAIMASKELQDKIASKVKLAVI
jgi:recombination protein RecA